MKLVIDDVVNALEGSPEPHHMRGSAEYIVEGNMHRLRGKVLFDSGKYPSIGTRTEKYLQNPHVNLGDFSFAVWNGAHIICNQIGYKMRTLGKVVVKPKRLITPDKVLDIEVTADVRGPINSRGEPRYFGRLQGVLSDNDGILIELTARYIVGN